MTRRGRLAAPVVGAGLARGYLSLLRTRPPGDEKRWLQVNYAGRSVSRVAGPAYALATLSALPMVSASWRVRSAATVAIGSAAAVGMYDDLAGDGSVRGLAGHGSALASGRVTTGTVKVAGLVAGSLVAGALLRPKLNDAALAGVVIAGTANVANLLDLRPGRAVKAACLPGLAALPGPAGPCTAAALGASAALLPDELRENVMLGDCGAGALGAAIGVGLAAGASTQRLRRLVAIVSALTVASEFVSFSRVIERVRVLRVIDHLGRR
ncbi:MAG: hypothetical protein ACJ735_13170 [Actinomycetes bacterium]